MLKKINAGIGLFTALLLMDHAVFFSVWMLSGGSVEKSGDSMPRILATIMMVHVILSVLILLFNRRGAEKKKYNLYPGLNIGTWVQRGTGVLILLLVGLHIAGAYSQFQPRVLHIIVHPVFFAAALAHVSVSFGRGLITLGIGNGKAIRVVDAAVKVLCFAVFAAGVVGFCTYFSVGGAR